MKTGEFTKRLLIAAGIVLAIAFIIYAHKLLLVVFAAILFAVFLNGLATILRDHSAFSYNLSLGVVVFLLIGLIVGAGWLLGPRLAQQGSQMSERIPEAIGQLETSLEQNQIGRILLSQQQQILTGDTNVMGRITGLFSTTFGALTYLLVILVTGLFIAVNPWLYIRGVFHLVPQQERRHTWEVFTSMGQALRWWLVGQFAAMTVVGILTTTGLLIAGVPLALTLGLIAGTLSFVPYAGPVLSAVPGILIAMMEGFRLAVYAAFIYIGVQLIESNLITPVIQRHAVLMPPALLIVGQVVMGYLAGAVGLFLATPFLVIAVVAVQILYVEEEIGDRVTILGEE